MEQIKPWVRPEDMERIDSIEKANKFISEQTEEIKSAVAEKKAAAYLFCEFRSSVAAALTAKALGDRLLCIHTDSGFIPQKVSEATVSFFRDKTDAELICIDGKESFMEVLSEDLDGYAKRTHSIKLHQNIFFDETEKRGDIGFLVDSETYVQILEQMQDAPIKVQCYRRKSVKKNPADNYEIISPLCYLYHDEVRLVGKALGLPDEVIYTRPITPSGLASRCTGKITKERLEALHRADTILCEEFKKCGLADRLYQYFIVVPDIVSVGVKDESRYEGYPAVIRAVTTKDGVTAEISEIPYSVLHAVTNRIITEVPGINRVLYDLSPKPTATIEWE